VTKITLEKMTVEQLLERFIELCVEQYDASELGQAGRYNRSFRKMRSVENELKIRPGDARSALMPLYDHPNPQVQLMAAEATLAIAPEAARDALRAIKLRRWNPYQAMNAGMCLRTLDEGTFKPT
jgi:enoyl reductase-like protein